MKKKPRGRFRHAFMNEQMRKWGWVVTGVPGKAIYTVGLMERGHPEVMVHGLGPTQTHDLLIRCVEMVEKGHVFEPGIHDQVAEGFPTEFVEVHPSNFHDWLGQALDYHESWSRDPLRFVQLVWCDRNGKFPRDPEYEDEFKHQLMFDVRRPEYEIDEGRVM